MTQVKYPKRKKILALLIVILPLMAKSQIDTVRARILVDLIPPYGPNTIVNGNNKVSGVAYVTEGYVIMDLKRIWSGLNYITDIKVLGYLDYAKKPIPDDHVWNYKAKE